jgi:hypothetical protein
VILGGRSVTWGTLAGAAAYSVLNAETTSLPGLSDLLLGIMLVVVLGYLPSGLTGITVPASLRPDPARRPAGLVRLLRLPARADSQAGDTGAGDTTQGAPGPDKLRQDTPVAGAPGQGTPAAANPGAGDASSPSALNVQSRRS